MGFIKAFTGALSGTFADQWKDFYGPMQGVPGTVAIIPAVPQGSNNGRGVNVSGSNGIISNGSKILVPEGMALITMENGAVTGCVTEPGGFEFRSDDINSQSMFSGDGIISSTLKQSWDRFKYGGQPGAQQLAFYVNLKEIPGIKFGTPAVIHWNDAFLETMAGGTANGTYSVKITDPLLFLKQFVPVKYLQPDAPIFDFNDLDNEAGNTLFGEFTNCLKSALAKISGEAKAANENTLNYIEANQVEITKTMGQVVEESYQWTTNRGLIINSVMLNVAYDEPTQELFVETQQDDRELRKASRMGEKFQNNMAGMMAAASAQAMQNAASNPNGAMMGFMGMNFAGQNAANVMGAAGNMQQQQFQQQPEPQQPASQQPEPQQPVPQQPAQQQPQEDPYEKLSKLKKLLDEGVISQEEFDAAKSKLLGV